MGSGGVGGYFGAKLVLGGADVSFVARGSHLAAMRRDGLTIESAHDPIHLPKVNVTDDPVDHRPGRHGDVLRQALGHRGRRAPAHADRRARDRDHLVPERRAEGRHAAPDLRRQGADGRRRLCRHDHRPARRDPADRAVAAPGVRRIRRPPLGARRDVPRRLQEGRHQCRALRRRPALALGKIRGAGRDVGRDRVHAPHHRPDPRPSADARIPDRPGARGRRGRPRARRQPAGGLCRAADCRSSTAGRRK